MTASSIQVTVGLDDRQYPIHIGAGLLANADRLVADHVEGRHVIIISDAAIRETHGMVLTKSLNRVTSRLDHLSIAGGEGAKSLVDYSSLMEDLLDLGVDRRTVLVALGGGVIGDLVGFAAASLLRGVDFIQAPTTLLAQVDSSVGGKTGVNARAGKNLIGAFYQPRAVLADTNTLKTLPLRECRAGYAEVVKYGLLGDADFFAWLEDNGERVLTGDEAVLSQAITHCCRAKAAIVVDDERESGNRALLNLGHTFGHAYEAEGGYDGSVLHGEAIAAGMVDAFRLARRLGYVDTNDDLNRVTAHLAAVGLPLSRQQLSNRLGEVESDRLINHMKKDKKANAGHIVLIVPHGIGDARIDHDVNEADVLAVLEGEM
jgi:3-dehydroquinate synthase